MWLHAIRGAWGKASYGNIFAKVRVHITVGADPQGVVIRTGEGGSDEFEVHLKCKWMG